MARRSCVPVLAVALALAWVSPAGAQQTIDFEFGSNWLVGYTANAPKQLLGLGTAIWLPSTSPWGLYVDGKFTMDSPANDAFESTLTPADAIELGDLFLSTRSEWTSVNVAVLRGFSQELAVYVGGGLSREVAFEQYLDRTGERGELGRYWVEEEADSGNRPNLIAGGIFRVGDRFAFQFGAETAPVGGTVGVHVRIR